MKTLIAIAVISSLAFFIGIYLVKPFDLRVGIGNVLMIIGILGFSGAVAFLMANIVGY